jgi:hemerythrin superfamily protein
MEMQGMAQTQPETQELAAAQTGKSATGRNPNEPKSNPAEPKNGAGKTSDTDPTEMLKSDHRHVEELFSSFEKATNAEQKSQLAAQICTELMVHTLLAEEIFYPACRGDMDQRLLEEAQVEHDGAKTLIIEIHAGSPDDQYFNAKVKVLSEEIKHHVREEEKSDGVLAKAKEARQARIDGTGKGGSSRPAGDTEFPRSNQYRDQSAISGGQDGTRIQRNDGTRARRARTFCQRRRRRSRLSPTFVQSQPVR